MPVHRVVILQIFIPNLNKILLKNNDHNQHPIPRRFVDIVKVTTCLNVCIHVSSIDRFLPFFLHSSYSPYNVRWKWCVILSSFEKMPLCIMYSCDQYKSYPWWWFRWWYTHSFTKYNIDGIKSFLWELSSRQFLSNDEQQLLIEFRRFYVYRLPTTIYYISCCSLLFLHLNVCARVRFVLVKNIVQTLDICAIFVRVLFCLPDI